MQEELSRTDLVQALLTVFIVMPLGVTFFWIVGVTKEVPGALWIVPIVGYGVNLALIGLAVAYWLQQRRHTAKAEGRV